jgi:hypothetical protein
MPKLHYFAAFISLMLKKPLCFFLFLTLVCACESSPDQNGELIENLMKKEGKTFKRILEQRDQLEIQIIYTQIDRDINNHPTFTSYYFNVDSTKYFYPASTVKLPLVLLALEKLQILNKAGLDRNTTMLSDSVYAGQQSVHKDTTSESGLPSIGHYAKKIMVVSDNDAFNRLYEFMGQKEINQILSDKGFNIRILHRLERAMTPDQNRHTEALRFVANGSIVYQQPMLINQDSIHPVREVVKGLGYVRGDSLISQPFDFTYKNDFSLQEQQELIKTILFPQAVDEKKRFKISEPDRQFVLQYLSQLPRETTYPPYYKDTTYYDAYCKFLMFGEDKTPLPTNLRIFNKVGDAYGYMIDNAYIVDFANGVEFMLSAVINTNTDQIYNDGKYEYQTLGFPFMKDLGRLIYNYELMRKRPVKPDLSEFKLKYDR